MDDMFMIDVTGDEMGELRANCFRGSLYDSGINQILVLFSI